MKVILLQDIYKHGVVGEVVDVADGFARNYLIPRKMAVKATKSELKSHRHLQAKVEARRAAYENKVNEVARQIDGTELFFERRAANTGKLFGSVTTQEIADELDKQTGIDINRRRISQQALREVGVHRVSVRLGNENPPELVIHIVREGDLEEYMKSYMAAKEQGIAAEAAAAEAGLEAPTTELPVTERPTEVIDQSMVQEALAQRPSDEAADEGESN